MNKKQLLEKFQKTPKKYWYLQFLKDNGFIRKKCKKCGKYFWTKDPDQEVCNDSTCRPYEFIGNPPTKKEFDYFSLWEKIKKFFEKEGHTNVKRYPVICRWFPDLYFTIAGVVDFYRKDGNNFVFELPANPVIILQPSLRFNDIPQVGVSGRHFTSHSHLEQSSLFDGNKGYWKERCIELDYRMLTEILGIKPEKINFIEDVWLGPGAFGYSLEYHVAGLELGNAVFTEFRGTPENFSVMKEKLIDMGAGFDRMVWISKGTPTNYDALWGDIIKKVTKKLDIPYDDNAVSKYSRFSGSLGADNILDMEKARLEVAEKIGMSVEEFENKIRPIQSLFAIIDHVQTLMFAISDGGIPSNIGGGYNLRVILRRSLSFIERYNWDLDLNWIAEMIAEFWKPLYPELKENLEKFKIILEIEKSKYVENRKNAEKTLKKIFESGKEITESKLVELYDSKGISPELVKEIGKKYKINVPISSRIYRLVTEKHEMTKPKSKELIVDEKKLEGVEKTTPLYYDKIYEFDAKVLKIIDNYVILDKTAFYPRGGGQEPDQGKINNCKVIDVEKINNIILHEVEKINFKEGDIVRCVIDEERRNKLTQHHTATHIINAASRMVLGEHVWQTGAKKDVDKAHLDISHYKSLTKEEVDKIEKTANEIVKGKYKVTKEVLDRPEAEKRYGFRIYQGAAVPSRKLRIVSIDDIDHEACAGTHVDDTEEVERILILKTEKPHDGAVRIIYVAGDSLKEYSNKCKSILNSVEKLLETNNPIEKINDMISEIKENRKKIEKLEKEIADIQTQKLKFESYGDLRVLIAQVDASPEELQKISLKLSGDDTVIFLFGVKGDKINIFASSGKKFDKDIGELVKKVSEFLGGRGGGSKSLGRGFGTKIDLLEEAKTLVRDMLNG